MNRIISQIRTMEIIPAHKYRCECCFAADTLVMTPECPRPIQSFTEGDWVTTYDLYSGKLVKTIIEKVDLHIGTYNLMEVNVGRNSQAVWATPGHRFFDGFHWIPCEEMNMTLTGTGELHAAVSFRSDRSTHAVYNLRTKKGTYLVGDEAALVSGGVLKDLHTQKSPLANQKLALHA
ncbi:MAG: hypothetical protein PHP44_03855 [Kiritimatiellae bacterium]|nr:hypothetical protein [Kiritimatiellia bacterium]